MAVLFLLPNKVTVLYSVWLMGVVVALIPKLKVHKWQTFLVGLVFFLLVGNSKSKTS